MNYLEKRAKELRKKVLDMGLQEGEAHLGGSFSEIEILVSLYECILKKEDKFILSKGHCSHPLYILLRERGYNPKICCHPDIDEKNNIFCTTGSLGHGLPIGVGMAFARKIQNKPGEIYVLMGDGECEEGTTWESLLIASKYQLDNLIIIVDNNGFQALEELVFPLDNLKDKFGVFGCYTSEIDGHNFTEILNSLKKREYMKPRAIIAKTIKGKGVSYIEGNPEWHAKKPTIELLRRAYEELR